MTVEQIVFIGALATGGVEVETARRDPPAFRISYCITSVLFNANRERSVSQPSCASPRLASTGGKIPTRDSGRDFHGGTNGPPASRGAQCSRFDLFFRGRTLFEEAIDRCNVIIADVLSVPAVSVQSAACRRAHFMFGASAPFA